MIIEQATEFSRDIELNLNKPDIEFLKKTMDFLFEEVRETDNAVSLWQAMLEEFGTDSLDTSFAKEIVDGFGDVAFVAINGIYKAFRMFGADHDIAKEYANEVMLRICQANLGKKQPDGSVQYLNGKVVKPEGWCEPIYSDLFKGYGIWKEEK